MVKFWSRNIILAFCLTLCATDGKALFEPIPVKFEKDKQCFHIFISEYAKARVENFLKNYSTYLRQELMYIKLSTPNHLILGEDPLVCRFCSITSSFLLRDLNNRFPKGRWKVLTTRNEYQGIFHKMIFSEEYGIFVDATYRQFLMALNLPNFEIFPSIFVGTYTDLQRLLSSYFPANFIKSYLLAYEDAVRDIDPLNIFSTGQPPENF